MDVKIKAPSSSPNVGGCNAQPSRKQNAGNNKSISKVERCDVQPTESGTARAVIGSIGKCLMINCSQ